MATQTVKTTQEKSFLLPITIIGVMFFVIGFALGINGYLIPFLKKALDLSSTQSYLVLAATFSAFIVFGYPSGLIIKKVGYKKGMMLSFFFFAIGLALFVPSARLESLPLFLLASFISGLGNTLLQASVNPYITILGPQESAAMRISIMGIINKAAWAIAPIFLSLFMNLESPSLESINFPFYLIIGIFVILGIFSNFAPLPEVKAAGEDEEDSETPASSYASSKTSIMQFPHLILGVVALFAYVGVETIALATIVDYADSVGLENPATYTTYTVIFMVVGYLVGVFFIPKVISQNLALNLCAWLGVVSSALVIFSPAATSIWFVAVLGLANSLMWPAIWPLAIADLGKFTKTGASLLVMGIVGGAVLPLVFGFVKDELGDIQSAYWVTVPAYLFILFYAIKGHKVR
ncbi:glucose/galactose MFS transporter [Limibacter armeniacum]|uniref:glucose/galactose MFS transporter n=1 Tax=Limibacter armeniacum TaxID=466084 RepID=UPI002FE51B8E